MQLAKRLFLFSGLCGLLLLPAGCAKAPGGSNGAISPVSGPQLLVTMTVRGTINPSYYYFVLFNVNNQRGPGGTSVTGPVPVVAPPYGNGFAAGAFTNYVQYHATNGGTGFSYYAISPDLLTPVYLGSTGPLVQSAAGTSTLSFQIPLAQLVPTGSSLTVNDINQLEVNFVATNTLNVIGDSLANPKFFDSLGMPESTGTYVNINVRLPGGAIQQGLYQNSDTSIEGQGADVATAGNGMPQVVTGTVNGVDTTALDITDWSIRLNPQ